MDTGQHNPFGILTYHRVVPWIVGVPRPTWNVTPERFRRQLEGLLWRGYRPWPLGRVLAHRRAGEPIPPHVFVVTFDDGYQSVYHDAWPILKELSVPATVFVVTSYLDADCRFAFDDWPAAGSADVPATAWQPLSTAQCVEMLEHGLVDIGSHTHTHADHYDRPETFCDEMTRSLNVLRDMLGVKQAPFAFPYGLWNPDLVAAVRQSGASCALTTVWERVPPQADPFMWGRFTVKRFDTAATLALRFGDCYASIRAAWHRLPSLHASPAHSGSLPEEEGTNMTVGRAEPEDVSSSLATVLEPSISDGPAEPMMRTGALSVFDQGVVSGTNFLTTLILARACSQAELGVYSLAWTVVVFLAAVQGNLITLPYTIYNRRRRGAALADYAGSTLAHQLLTSLAAMACFCGLILAISLGLGPESLRPAAWVLLGAAPFLLLREYARRFTLAHFAMGIAITIDVVVAVLQLGVLLALRHLGLLSAAAAYGAMGAACAVACLCWWFLDSQPMCFSRARFWRDWGRNWSFGKWAMMSQMTGMGACLLPWMLAMVHGEEATGQLAACSTLVGLSNLFVMGLNNFLTPNAAQAFAERGAHALFSVLYKATLCFVVVLGGLCLVLLFVGNLLAGILYGPGYANTGSLIVVLALATFVDAIGLAAGIGLWAMDRPAANIRSDLVQLLVTLGTALWLVSPWGALGIAAALVIGRTAGATARWLTLWGLMGWKNSELSMA
jgi:O-antigen/teichoic acid export membrane protein/peptidoglycan/xylan/chitin deacetylase (PgdA/CDA1 family)